MLAQNAEYSLVSKLIGMVCRFIFQPIEEAAFIKFSKKEDSKDVLQVLLSVLTAISFNAVIFAYLNGMAFLSLAYQDKWADSSCLDMLKAGMLQTVFLGANGIIEAYAFAKTTSQEKIRYGMLFNAGFYVVACQVFTQWWGVKGLLHANSFSMALRSILNLWVSEISFPWLLLSVLRSKYFVGLFTLGLAANFVIS